MDKFWLGFEKQAAIWSGVLRRGIDKTVKNVDNVLDYKKINAPAPAPIKQNSLDYQKINPAPTPKPQPAAPKTLDYAAMKAPSQPPVWKQKMEAQKSMNQKSYPGVIDDVSKKFSKT